MKDRERLEGIKQIHQKDGRINRIDNAWLIQQAEEKQELLESNIQMSKHQHQLRKDAKEWYEMASQLEQQNKRYEEALEFYAEKENWKKLIIDENTMYLGKMRVEDDYGKKAQQALQNK